MRRGKPGKPAGAGAVLLALLVGVLLGACSGGEKKEVSPRPVTEGATETPAPAVEGEAAEAVEGPAPAAAGAAASVEEGYLLFNQRLLEGVSTTGLDLNDVDAVFAHVFARLPDEVIVYPSENYYYFILYVDGRQIWGNLRLPAGRREHGVLSFAYFEFIEFPTTTEDRLSASKFYTAADGVLVEEVDPFTYTIGFDGKTVTFHFHELDQSPPTALPLGEDELLIERTFDESGYQFFLLFNDQANYFFWVLNEEETVPDVLEPLAEDLLVGKRSGFAFWVDEAHGDRKVLAGVRSLNIRRNDYFDGPFDQLADNYVDETHISEYMQRAYPGLQGRIDKYGYYTDQEQPLRVALSTYYAYPDPTTLVQFIELVRAQEDPYAFISSGGRTATTPPAAEETAPPEEAPAPAGEAEAPPP